MNIAIQPTKDRILIEKTKEKELVTESGLVISTNVKHVVNQASGAQLVEKEVEEQDDTCHAVVLKVGPSVTEIKVGDTVMITKYAGVRLNRKDEFFMIAEHDVIAIVG